MITTCFEGKKIFCNTVLIHHLQSHAKEARKVTHLAYPNLKKAKYKIKMNVSIISDDDEYRARI